mmetsp:Transcript_18234/g.39794  ORF Transcript_18234/g.39794 Transcript_18234/m.39794 type:complete len:740 (-) Transcript_18234:165-2384(-)
MTSTHHKPLCPCCQRAYAANILSGDRAAADTEPPPKIARFLLCHSCAPSDVERALAAKYTGSPDGASVHTGTSNNVPPIVWLLTPSEIQSQTDEILAETKSNLDSIASVPLSSVTFANTVTKLMTPPNYKTNPMVCAVKFLQHCSPDPDIRSAAQDAGKRLSASRVEGRMRGDVYERVKAFSLTEECEQLSQYEKHFVKSALGDFERAGLALSSGNAQKLRDLLEQDAAVCSEYGSNLGGDATKLYFKPEELEGCGDDFVKERLGKDKEGVCTITLKYPDIIPIGTNCVVAETRRLVAQAREGPAAYKNNLDLVAQGITIRKQIATLLGYASWAEYICSQRMSGSYAAVDEFLTSLETKLRDAGKANIATLLNLKKTHFEELGIEFDGKLNAWDSGFYNNLLLKRDYGVDSEKIREYFPLSHVVETTLQIYQELLGLTFTELPVGTYWSWHGDVRCFDVKDTTTEERIGHFYLDLFPREGKYGHAAIFHLVKRSQDHAAVDCMLCNLPPPGADGNPSLLRHTNVVTFFHEFGHIMHGLCAEGIGNSTRLAKCPRDFVEAPSQMLENWCWQKAILERLSRHYETGKSLPDDMLESMLRAKHVNVAIGSLRQIYLSRLDLTIHGSDPPKDAQGLQDLVDELRPRISLMDNPPGNNMLRTFGHLMNQYSASYYGYMWAEVLSADMFATRFEEEGIMNPQTGMDYRKMVLAPGGTGRIMDHLTNFLGRKPSDEAFLKSRGIVS